MSRSAHLPPRCPLNIKHLSSSRSLDSTLSQQIKELYDCSQETHSKNCILEEETEEQTSWIDDLLHELEGDSQRVPLRRAVSDSAVLLESLSMCPGAFIANDEGCSKYLNSGILLNKKKDEEIGGIGGLEASCIYGPNSPRERSRATASETAIVSALAECVPQNPLLSVSQNPAYSLTVGPDAMMDSVGNLNTSGPEIKPVKRHFGQRSRVRKLKYIQELEETVKSLENLKAELAARVSSECQQRIILSVENSTLEKQIASIHKEKLVKDAQYQSLKKELALLKIYSRKHQCQSSSYFHASPMGASSSEINWQMLDMGKLSLGGSTVTLNHGLQANEV